MTDAPETRYAKAKDGIHIAYQTAGDGRLDLAFMTGWSHLEARWENPQYAHFLNRLASFSRLIIFDRRGTGESDPLATDRGLSWEEWTDDLRLVLDTVGSERAALIGTGEGGSMATLYAATYPERTTALALLNSAPRWVRSDDYPWGVLPDQLDHLLDLFEQTWGTGLSPLLMTSPVDAGFRRWWGKYGRMCASPAERGHSSPSCMPAMFARSFPSCSAQHCFCLEITAITGKSWITWPLGSQTQHACSCTVRSFFPLSATPMRSSTRSRSF